MPRENVDQFVFDNSSKFDLYLSPHFDDICFSLGGLVSRQRQGKLLTFFSNSSFIAKTNHPMVNPGAGAFDYTHQLKVSAVRRSEDLAFCNAVGLQQVVARLDEAPVRGRHPFVNAIPNSEKDAELLRYEVMNSISGAAVDRPNGIRPRLYCPMAIGDHVDHLTILRIVLDNLKILREVYDIAFYEDLHYASDFLLRRIGVKRFRSMVTPFRPRKFKYLIQDIQSKLDLVRLYDSQFESRPTSIGPFTPALNSVDVPHEAVWTADGL